MPRFVYDASPDSAKQLNHVAQTMATSKVKAIQLAVSVLSKLAGELSKGSEIILRSPDGRETELWLPYVSEGNQLADEPPAVHAPALRRGDSSDARNSASESSRGRRSTKA